MLYSEKHTRAENRTFSELIKRSVSSALDTGDGVQDLFWRWMSENPRCGPISPIDLLALDSPNRRGVDSGAALPATANLQWNAPSDFWSLSEASVVQAHNLAIACAWSATDDATAGGSVEFFHLIEDRPDFVANAAATVADHLAFVQFKGKEIVRSMPAAVEIARRLGHAADSDPFPIVLEVTAETLESAFEGMNLCKAYRLCQCCWRQKPSAHVQVFQCHICGVQICSACLQQLVARVGNEATYSGSTSLCGPTEGHGFGSPARSEVDAHWILGQVLRGRDAASLITASRADFTCIRCGDLLKLLTEAEVAKGETDSSRTSRGAPLHTLAALAATRCVLCPRADGVLAPRLNLPHAADSPLTVLALDARSPTSDEDFQTAALKSESSGGEPPHAADDPPLPWVHPECADWHIPSRHRLTAFNYVDRVDKKAFATGTPCAICGVRNCGAYLTCFQMSCTARFHASCGKLVGCRFEGSKTKADVSGFRRAYCPQHSAFTTNQLARAYLDKGESEPLTEGGKLKEAVVDFIVGCTKAVVNGLCPDDALLRCCRQYLPSSLRSPGACTESSVATADLSFPPPKEEEAVPNPPRVKDGPDAAPPPRLRQRRRSLTLQVAVNARPAKVRRRRSITSAKGVTKTDPPSIAAVQDPCPGSEESEAYTCGTCGGRYSAADPYHWIGCDGEESERGGRTCPGCK
eukprot:Polyplicarium_translucidae@DN2928_c0_g1_i6.p1